MNAGAVSFRLGLRGMPVEAEAGIVERDIELAREDRRAYACGARFDGGGRRGSS